ncbi:MAG TPA: fibronectin type III domain-containing protein [Candidatus Acidoferrum sp.]|nr:fibronectin type III domain-containing protein [Candidatus Acidoferrum sp.]
MIRLPRKFLPVVVLFIPLIFDGCGGGGSGSTTSSATLRFTSTPTIAAEEGAAYTYQVTATSSDMSAITYALSSGPAGATLAGSTVTWTPTHAESRVGNAFTVRATTATGGSATQTWNVTPNGNINITDVVTHWGSAGPNNVPRVWPAGALYPAALVPQADGSLLRMGGAVSPDGTFGIPNVPGGYVWLQVGPFTYYWIATSDFDFGEDLIGMPVSGVQPATTTTFNYSISGLEPAPVGAYLTVQSESNAFVALPFPQFLSPVATSLNTSLPVTSVIDWSQITTLFIGEYESTSGGGFTGYTLGPSETLTGLTITDGATNNITATLSPSPAATVPLNIQGTSWASVAGGIGPGVSGPGSSNYFLYAQPYLADRLGAIFSTGINGPPFTMLLPAPAQPVFLTTNAFGPCGSSTFPQGLPAPTFSLPAIVTDVDYGTLSYGDPFPAAWQRLLEYCQVTAVNLPRPNSTVTDTFLVANRQTTAVPTGPVKPIVSPVQNPMINGESLFQTATLNTTSVNLSWTAPASGQPFGYYVNVYELATLLNDATEQYIAVGRFGTAKTSVQVPFLSAGNTYVFMITSETDGIAKMETNPLRAQAPNGEAAVVSAPFVIATGATTMAKH